MAQLGAPSEATAEAVERAWLAREFGAPGDALDEVD
jgi:hypothetical protein